jgi:mannan endo-1,4-beta-mannosidase
MDVGSSSHPRGTRVALRVAGFLALVGAFVLAVILIVQPTALPTDAGWWAWALAAVLLGLGVLPHLPPRPGTIVPVLAAATVGALVAYVVIASPSERQAVATPSSSAAAPAGPSTPSSAATPVLPRPAQLPILGISAATVDDLDRFVAATGTHPEVFDVFEAWSRHRPLDRGVADDVAARGARLSITWEPWDPDGSHTRQPQYTLASIINGDHDDYIDMFASSIKQFPAPVTIRLMHEMNGNWYPWGTQVNGNRPAQFVGAWQHVHDRFTGLGVTNVQWMWAPNAVYTGGATLAPLYPGDAYVDAVGVSNYNWGDHHRDGFATQWLTFDALFDESIALLQSITVRPLWIAETGSSSSGGSKAAWIAGTLAEIQQRPEIAGLVWFDHVDEQAGVDWRIEQEPDAADAWRAGFISRPPA